MNTLLKTLGIVLTLDMAAVSTPALAQLDPTIVAQGQVLSGMQRGYAERGRGRSGGRYIAPRHRALCANKARYRAQYGPNNPDIRKLYALCRSNGL